MKVAKKYKCIKDLQGGCFAVDAIATAKEWKEIALNWCYNDGNIELEKALKRINKNEEIINFIQELWQIEIIELEYTTIKISNEILKKGYKVCVEINGEYYEIKESKEEIRF